MTSSLLVAGRRRRRSARRWRWLLTGGKKRKLVAQHDLRAVTRRVRAAAAALPTTTRRSPRRPRARSLFRSRRDHRRQGRRARRHHRRRRAGAARRRARDARPGGTRPRRRLRMLREMGIFGAGRRRRLREIRNPGQRTAEQLIDRYPIACRPIRDLLVDYLKRAPARDRLHHPADPLAYQLARLLLGRHRAPPSRHRLAAPAARRRRRVEAAAAHQDHDGHHRDGRQTDGHRRAAQLPRLPRHASGRSTSTWPSGRWTTRPAGARGWRPCPVRPGGHRRGASSARRRKARMDARTRERLPVLPVAGPQPPTDGATTPQALLAAARQAEPGQHVHRRRADPDPVRPAARRARQRLGRRPRHRQAAAT